MPKKKGKDKAAHKAAMAARKAKREEKMRKLDTAAAEVDSYGRMQTALNEQSHHFGALQHNATQFTRLLKAGLDPNSHVNRSREAGILALNGMLSRLKTVDTLSSSRPNLLEEAAETHAAAQTEAAEVGSGAAPAASGGPK